MRGIIAVAAMLFATSVFAQRGGHRDGHRGGHAGEQRVRIALDDQVRAYNNETLRLGAMVARQLNMSIRDLQDKKVVSVVLVGKSRRGFATASLSLGGQNMGTQNIGTSADFRSPRPNTYNRLFFDAPRRSQQGRWLMNVNGRAVKLKAVIVTIQDRHSRQRHAASCTAELGRGFGKRFAVVVKSFNGSGTGATPARAINAAQTDALNQCRRYENRLFECHVDVNRCQSRPIRR